MGLSASQARYLTLTARRNDNEYQGQQLAQQKSTLAQQMEFVATEYSQKMSNRKLLFVKMDGNSQSATTTTLSYDIITSTDTFNGMSMRIVDSKNRVVVPTAPASDYANQLQNAKDAYNKAISNKCFTGTTTDSNGNKTEMLYSGQNFLNTYQSATNGAILDKNGNPVDLATFKQQTQSLNAPDFYDFWNNSGYSLQNQNILSNDRYYTEDDDAAKLNYQNTAATIQENQSTSYLQDSQCKDSSYLEGKLRSGEWTLQKKSTDASTYGSWQNSTWEGNAQIQDSLDTSDDGAAEAEYTSRSAFFQQKDKEMELQMKQLDTEHNALQTEMDSVKKVMDKNVESSFKTFA